MAIKLSSEHSQLCADFSGPVVYLVHRYTSTPFLVSAKLSSGCVPAIMQDIKLLCGDRLEY